MSVYRFVWVTDPHYPSFVNKQRIILLMLQQYSSLDSDFELVVVQTQVGNGCVQTEAVLVLDNEDIAKQITTLIGEISFEPVSTVLNIPLITTDELIGLQSIYLAVAQEKLFQPLSKLEIVKLDLGNDNIAYKFFPLNQDGQYIYKHPNNQVNIIDLERYRGYQLLSADPFVRYVLNQIYPQYNYDILYHGNMALVKLGPVYEDKIVEVDMAILDLHNKGYFILPITPFNSLDILHLKHLCKLWQIELVHIDVAFHVIFKTNVDFTLPTIDWFRENLARIRLGQLPLFAINGDWIDRTEQPFILFSSRLYARSYIYYGAIRAYVQLCEEFPALKRQIQYLRIALDLSIVAPFETFEQAMKFKQLYKQLMSTASNWDYVECKDMKEAIIKRWFVLTVDNGAQPLIIDIENKPICIFHSIQSNPIEFHPWLMEEAELSLTDALRKFYSNCPTDQSKASLEELLLLVPVFNRDNTGSRPDACLSYSQVEYSGISVETRYRLQTYLFALRGLYGLGPIKGLFVKLPYFKFGPINLGSVGVQNVAENRYAVQVSLGCTSSLLFEIMLKETDVNKLNETVEKLWQCGFFASSWLWAVYTYLEDLSISVNLPKLLLKAGNSIEDGKVALNYLESAYC